MRDPERIAQSIVHSIDRVTSDEDIDPFVFLFHEEVVLHDGPERLQLGLSEGTSGWREERVANLRDSSFTREREANRQL
jgi:hypothetical protein